MALLKEVRPVLVMGGVGVALLYLGWWLRGQEGKS